MASIDSQNYSPLLEKRNFKDLLEDEMVAVEEDLITKIFSQTVQVSPSEEVPEPYAQTEGGGGDGRPQLEQRTHNDDKVIVDHGDAGQEPVDRVPTDLSHFNQTIVDNDEADDVVDHCAEEPPFVDSSAAITLAATECVDEIIGELEEHINHHPQAITPSTASPVDHEEADEDEEEDPVDDQLLSEIRDFEEIERITEVSPEKEVVHLMMSHEEPMIAAQEEAEEEEITPEIEMEDDSVPETADQEEVQQEGNSKAQQIGPSNTNDEYKKNDEEESSVSIYIAD